MYFAPYKEQICCIFAPYKEQYMEDLILKFRKKLERTQINNVRDFINKIPENTRLTGIKGARGTGKTTLLLQYIKQKFNEPDKVLYASLDDLYFRRSTLYSMADQFLKYGGKLLVLDEVHKYLSWSEELKLIYDDFAELQVIFTGSSIIDLKKAKADLSRRAVMLNMNGLSFREYLKFTLGKEYGRYSLEEILESHEEITASICKDIRPLAHFRDYLSYGYYPYFMEGIEFYPDKMTEVINQVIENDLSSVLDISYATEDKLKAFLVVLSESMPFTPNISKLCDRIGVSRNVLIEYIYWLEQARLILRINRQGKVITRMQKPEKIYLHHPNLNYAINSNVVNTGSVREGFFANQLSSICEISIPPKGDFVVDNRYLFEIGGSTKNFSQIEDQPDSYLALDQIEQGLKNKIPLWIFGFLY